MKTERSSPRFSSIEAWDPADIVDCMVEGQFTAVAAVHAARTAIERAAATMEERLRDQGRLIYVGAGTSGRLAVQDGAELVPTFGWPEDRLLLLIAGGPDALLRSIEGAEDETQEAVRLIEHHNVGAEDVLVAVAASGTTPFTVTCLREAKRRGAATVGIANNQDTPLLTESLCPIWLDTGVELVAGSTRLKAGTAQKAALNALSTLLMIRLGRIYQGLMVDVRATNSKLRLRSENILIQLTECSRSEAQKALTLATGDVKTAVLLLHGCDLETATAELKMAGGRLGEAVKSVKNPKTD